MKIAVISDLHLEHRWEPSPVPIGHFNVFGSVHFPFDLGGADVLVVAGDTHPDPNVCRTVYQKLREVYGIPLVTVEGNHEFYGRSFPGDPLGDFVTIAGVTFASATLWTKLRPLDEMIAHTFADFEQISGTTVHAWNERHDQHLDFLMKAQTDVIVTHHAPSRLSIHRKFQNHSLNPFFINDLDIELLFPKCKLWVHGHVHQDFDYTVGATRVVCCPHAYPWENNQVRIKLVEI